MKIILKPIGDFDKNVPEELKGRLKQTFGCPVEIALEDYNLEKAYDSKRKQYLATKLLSQLKKAGVAKGEKVLGIVDVDLYAPGLNFIFGQADITAGTAAISLCRLRQEYYGSATDDVLFLDRTTKEAVHELGHTFGLEHCSNAKCVMHFSNSLSDTDLKQAAFCSRCRPKLIK
ncbi:MAG: archaemetzincin family Zn-dependent metalloprotease [Dehalococcoidia bacterium]